MIRCKWFIAVEQVISRVTNNRLVLNPLWLQSKMPYLKLACAHMLIVHQKKWELGVNSSQPNWQVANFLNHMPTPRVFRITSTVLRFFVFYFYFAHPYPAPNFSQILTKTIQLNWPLKDEFSMLWGQTFPGHTEDEKIIFFSITHTPFSHTIIPDVCHLRSPLTQSFGFVIYTYIYFFFSILCMGATESKASEVHFLFQKWSMVLQSKKQWSTKHFKVNCWCFPIKQVEEKAWLLQCSVTDVFCALKVLKCFSRLLRKHNAKKKATFFNQLHVIWNRWHRGSASSKEAWTFLYEKRVKGLPLLFPYNS